MKNKEELETLKKENEDLSKKLEKLLEEEMEEIAGGMDFDYLTLGRSKHKNYKCADCGRPIHVISHDDKKPLYCMYCFEKHKKEIFG